MAHDKCYAMCENKCKVEVIGKAKGFTKYKVQSKNGYMAGIKFDETLSGYPMVIPVSTTIGATIALADVYKTGAYFHVSGPSDKIINFIVYVIDADVGLYD